MLLGSRMPIEDPVSAAKSLVASDERMRSPVVRFAKQFAAVVKLLMAGGLEFATGSVDLAADLLDNRAHENRHYLLEVVADEVERIGPQLNALHETSEAHRRFLQEE